MTTIKPFTTTYNIRGHKYVVTANAEFNDQGKVIANKKLDDIAKEKALNTFRKEQDYVYPIDIKNFRKRVGFSQIDLANLLGMSPNTIALYELGALPSEANNNLLKLIMSNENNLKEIAATKHVSARVQKKINQYFNKEVVLPDNSEIKSSFSATQLANWFIVKHYMNAKNDENIEPLTQMKLVKLLYFAYGTFLAKTHNKLFTSEIRHYQWGPLVMEVHHQFEHQKIINSDISSQAYEDFINISANKEITDLLEYIYDKYGRYTATYLSKITHQKNSPWSQTADHEVIQDNLIYDSFVNNHEM